MRVSELSGDLLDYWVARAEGIEHSQELRAMRPGAVLVKVWSKEGFTFYTAYTPSTDIAQAWPIMDRERIDICHRRGALGAESVMAWLKDKGHEHSGPTAIVAAMRAYVASRFGETVPVEVPA